MQLKMFLLLSVLLSATFSVQAQQSTEEKAAMQVFHQVTEAFGALDAKAFSEQFTEDATLVNPIGTIIRSKQAIYEAHAYYFTTEMAKAEAEGSSEFVDVAFTALSKDLLHCTLTANWMVEGKKVGADTFGLIFRKTDAGWKIFYAQLTTLPQQMPNN
ncbi:MAG: nuclear transport factor 2 family protein [Phaeodactylibacter sp.]|nr:nuclear transport factor 2 family protein [Phaeodactylibacter sp.]